MPRVFQVLLIGAIAIASPLSAQTTERSPNSPNTLPEAGWGLWQPKAELSAAGFSAGFSNMELGSFLEFEHACAQVLGTTPEETPYWFRLSDRVHQIGTGTAEFGCWQAGKFVATITNTAVSTKLGDVNCLRVRVPTGEALRIRAKPGLAAKIIGLVPNGGTVKPNGSPAVVIEADQRDWIAIEAPKVGWVSNDRPETVGNLTLCR